MPHHLFSASAHLLWRLRDGTHIVLRPLQAQDSALLEDMLERLSPRARRNRFHGGVNSRPALLEPMQAEGGVAFVVVAENPHHTQVVAEARYAIDHDGEGRTAEFAVVVDDRWQRLGLGAHAMRALTNTASHAGLHWLYGDVLADNRAMLGLMQRCHFCCTPDQEDNRLVHAEISLRAAQEPAESNRWWGPRVVHATGMDYA